MTKFGVQLPDFSGFDPSELFGHVAGFTIGQPHEIPGLVAGHIEAGADQVLFSFAFADTSGITAVGEAFGLRGQ